MAWNIGQVENQLKWQIDKIEYAISNTQNKIILHILES